MKTVTAADANRQFSTVLQRVSRGEAFTVISRGKPVATIAPPSVPGTSSKRAPGDGCWNAKRRAVRSESR